MSDVNASGLAGSGHVCTADCWAYMLRNGEDENTVGCNPWAARGAAAVSA